MMAAPHDVAAASCQTRAPQLRRGTLGGAARFRIRSLGSNTMKTIRSKTFTGQRVVLDGKCFVDCHFKNADLIIEGNALFEMSNCKIEEDCRLAVEGPGKILLHTLKMMLHSSGWMSRVADNVLHAVRQPPKARTQPSAAAK
jgi:hypothetical protein